MWRRRFLESSSQLQLSVIGRSSGRTNNRRRIQITATIQSLSVLHLENFCLGDLTPLNGPPFELLGGDAKK